MFKFDFDLDDEEPDNQFQGSDVLNPSETPLKLNSDTVSAQVPFAEVPLSQLLDSLPTLISYSPLIIPLSSTKRTGSVTLARRDLFDARFQLISEGAGDGAGNQEDGVNDRTQALEFLDAPSDLVPGVYEGGLKTWECSLDLVDYLEGIDGGDVRGRRVLEIGCGTAVPSLYLLQKIFSSPPASSNASNDKQETHIHVQDYNASVLELVTLPNMILAWYMSAASATYRNSLPPDEEHPSANQSIPANLPISLSLKSAFRASLTEYNVHVRFFSGSWEGYDPRLTGGPYNLVLTSETIYRFDGLRPLIGLMQAACRCLPSPDGGRLHELVDQKLSLSSDHSMSSNEPHHYLCLVAAKVLYFGVGGGVSEFVRTVEGSPWKGKVETLWENIAGVGRSVMRVRWDEK